MPHQVAPGAAAPATAPPVNTGSPSAALTPGPAPAHVSGGARTLGYVFGGVGVAGLVVGGVSGILTIGAKHTNDQHCNTTTQTCDSQGHDAAQSGRRYGTLTTAGLAVGVAGLGLGTYF